MRLPAPLSRRKKNVHKNTFGHVLILAGSRNMLGAAALSGLSAMRSGAGLVTLGVPKSLESVLQKKISPVLMTLPLEETPKQSFSSSGLKTLKPLLPTFQAIAIGPGVSRHRDTKKFVRDIVATATQPLVIDADGLFALSENLSVLTKTSTIKILTPHPGEMSRLTSLPKGKIEKDRVAVAKKFARQYRVILLLKGHRTVIASPDGKVAINATGNPGMATAGSGDVLTGMLAAFLAQGLSGFHAAKWAAYLHGLAADLAARKKTHVGLIATDIIENIPSAFKRCGSA